MLDGCRKSREAKNLEQLNQFLPDSQFLQNIGGLYSTSVLEELDFHSVIYYLYFFTGDLISFILN